jgi:hypothetical protein
MDSPSKRPEPFVAVIVSASGAEFTAWLRRKTSIVERITPFGTRLPHTPNERLVAFKS